MEALFFNYQLNNGITRASLLDPFSREGNLTGKSQLGNRLLHCTHLTKTIRKKKGYSVKTIILEYKNKYGSIFTISPWKHDFIHNHHRLSYITKLAKAFVLCIHDNFCSIYNSYFTHRKTNENTLFIFYRININ